MLRSEYVRTLITCLAEYADRGRPASTTPRSQLIFLLDVSDPASLWLAPIGEDTWRGWDQQRRLPTPSSAEKLGELLATTAPMWLPQFARRTTISPLVGCCLTFASATDVDTASGRAAGQAVIARDIDGRVYHVARQPNVRATADVMDTNTLPGECGRIAAALGQILDSRRMFAYVLPTSGYLVRQTVRRDGQDPYPVTIMINVGVAANDSVATAHVQAEVARLRRDGPRNVSRTLRLVHRTPRGERLIWTANDIRGSAPPVT